MYAKGVRDSATFKTKQEASAWALERDAELTGAKLSAKSFGTANAITAPFAPAITATADGLKLRFAAAAANTGGATFAPNALTAAPILGQAGLALQGGEIATNGEVEVTWSTAFSAWVMTGAQVDPCRWRTARNRITRSARSRWMP